MESDSNQVQYIAVRSFVTTSERFKGIVLQNPDSRSGGGLSLGDLWVVLCLMSKPQNDSQEMNLTCFQMQNLHGIIIALGLKTWRWLKMKRYLWVSSHLPTSTKRKPTEKVTYPQKWAISYGKGSIMQKVVSEIQRTEPSTKEIHFQGTNIITN